MAYSERTTLIANPATGKGRSMKRKRNMTLKQKLHFGSARQRTAARQSLSKKRHNKAKARRAAPRKQNRSRTRAAAHRPRLFAALRPVLDLMQTLPTFVYLIPTLVLFGLGVVPGLISTVIFALPAPIRLTHLGISSVPRPLIEAGQSFGATPMQLLWKIELPSAATTIIAGITQCIMLSLSMVVIAALVGAGGLGVPVVRALNSVQVGMGFEAGFTIVLLAIILRSRKSGWSAPSP